MSTADDAANANKRNPDPAGDAATRSAVPLVGGVSPNDERTGRRFGRLLKFEQAQEIAAARGK